MNRSYVVLFISDEYPHLNLVRMKKWHKLLAFALFVSLFILESCSRGYGCPGADL